MQMIKPSSSAWLLLLLPGLVYAALGQRIDLSSSAPAAGRQQLAVTTGAAYRVVQEQDAAGRVIRQYVAGDGTVFAVAWSGPTLPNLQQLLGDYFPAFRQSQQANRRGLNAMQGQVGSFVVQSRGRLGNFSGFAYDSALLPAGVAIDQLK
ncbi:hypothetical protein B0T49_10385 [Chromobacterium violaceum]|nr:hypothetical protein UF16_04975 [Chromobacterium violaceum]OQS08283.1 hypothetical protein B0T38_21015 [Chromobacterium violaceum]OQS20886.1 hypothetical protein B0T37_21005 [Chromobacterium violaceum]OQS47980.1 hypothetical protein B0T48_10505 [Chromobacterium violaceum]OQS50775.1 hypothetical protein B0T49_10385 [Chromobacterium violaceum]